LTPTGNFLLAANQQTGNIVIFKRDKTTGLLTPTGEHNNDTRTCVFEDDEVKNSNL
jgi:6-phosphogluconolactonase (cycloisomerase 2 family)